jgi:hypothetical protein
MILARPQTMLGLAGLADGDTPKPPLFAEGRALGGVLIASHGVAALYLGYQPRIGAAMAMVLAVAWLGAAMGRAISAALDGDAGRRQVQLPAAILFNALIGVTCACRSSTSAGWSCVAGWLVWPNASPLVGQQPALALDAAAVAGQ